MIKVFANLIHEELLALAMIQKASVATQMKPLKTQKEVMELFEKWWDSDGSGMPPKPGEDAETHVKRISAVAWSNGAYCVGVKE
jgi:hypothetical protein